MQGIVGVGGSVQLDFSAKACVHNDAVSVDSITHDLAGEILAPLLDLARVRIDPIEMRLKIAVGSGDVTDFNGEEEVARVAGPAGRCFNGFVVGDAARGNEVLDG